MSTAREIEHESTAVAQRGSDQPAMTPAASDATAIIQVIERAAMNPNVDIDKMERLLEMQERILSRNAKAAYSAALARMQQELPSIEKRGAIKNKGGGVQSRYALWEDVNTAIKPVLAKHGFAISFRVGHESNMIVVTGVLSHEEGHSEETSIHLPSDSSGSKNAVQAVGSSTSYGKRYTAAALLNLTSHDEMDDDGQAGGAGETVDEDQLIALREMIETTEADIQRFCRHWKIEALPDLPAAKFDDAMKLLRAKANRIAGGGRSNG